MIQHNISVNTEKTDNYRELELTLIVLLFYCLLCINLF